MSILQTRLKESNNTQSVCVYLTNESSIHKVKDLKILNYQFLNISILLVRFCETTLGLNAGLVK